jgi:hypothetical protein
VEENLPARDHGAENPNIPVGDYQYDEAHEQYDEAHELVAELPVGTPAPHHVSPPPRVNLGEGGDYGYDEAHDFGAP